MVEEGQKKHKWMCLREEAHSRIHSHFCDITLGFLVFVFLKIVVKATLEPVLVKAETFLLVFFNFPPAAWENVASE